MAESKGCFVIAPIGEADSETRKRSDQVLKHIIRPAVEVCGYKATRADEIDKPGIITSQVIQRVVGDPLVVADLTERNPNVFYELAVRHALRKPLVQLIRKGDQIPFDVAGTRTIQVDHRDLDSVEATKNEIIDQIKAQERDPSEMETPISISLNVQILRQSEKPEERSLADLLGVVSGLATSLTRVETRIGTQGAEGVLDEIKNNVQEVNRRLEKEDGSFGLSKRFRFHPGILREIASSVPEPESTRVGLLIMASMMREAMPWLYELAVDLYRKIESGDPRAGEAMETLRRITEYSFHSPLREVLGGRKELFFIMEELESLLGRAMMTLPATRKRSPKES
jgi:hypothetical protein